ncbi:MAG: type II toxin-antitoxin system VapC family toxin [Actinomycetota bacterium]
MNYLEEFDINSSDLVKEARKNIFVIDSSVVFKWFFFANEGNLEIAKSIYEKAVQKEYYLLAPELLVQELLNIFKYKTDFTESRVRLILKNVFDILIIVKLDFKEYMEILKISEEINASIYDCIYIALAGKYNIPFITADNKLYKKSKNSKYSVLLLNEFLDRY